MKPFKRILVTSALPYANGPLHLGHIAGAYLPADIYVRFQRLKGRDILFICGSDEHGVPITVSADKEGVSPQKIVDRYHTMNKESFQKLGITFDNYSRTSLPVHHETAQEFFRILHEQGELIIKDSEQFYSESSKRFLPDRYVEGTCPHCAYEKARGDQCDQCGKWLEPGELLEPKSKIDGSTPILKKTQHWYLPMGKYAKTWKKWFEAKSWKENVRNYCMGWYNEGLKDRPITRDLHWGVPVPLENTKDKVLYVWFDAPIGYISSTKEWARLKGDPDKWKTYWRDSETKLVHFIGKDNIVFHAILFPMMLKQVGDYILPDAIPANEYLTIEGRKISTSENYAIWVKDYLDLFPPDPLRYTLAANAPESKDTDFSWRRFQHRNNDELADILGNFINRILTFVQRYFEGKVPEKGSLNDRDKEILKEIKNTKEKMEKSFEHFEVRSAIRHLMDLCRAANKYFNDSAPWDSRKSDPAQCASTLNTCIQIARALSVLMAPILPDASRQLNHMLGLDKEFYWNDIAEKELDSGHVIRQPEILFEKIEDKIIDEQIHKLTSLKVQTGDQEKTVTPQIDYETFEKVDLRTALVLDADTVKGADRLLKLEIDLGDEKRTIVAGIAQSYSPDEMKGRTVIVVANLKPATIRGVESHGMLLAVSGNNTHALVTTNNDVEPGSKVK